MEGSVNLGSELEAYVDRLVRDGRFASREEVLRASVRQLQVHGPDLGSLDDAIREGLADIDAGRTVDAGTAFRELRERYRPA